MRTEELIILKYKDVYLYVDLIYYNRDVTINKIWIGNQDVTDFLNKVDVLGLVHQEIRNELNELNK